ncbi:MAG TPA: hypothetical protein VJP80_01050 [Candidatus Saccharimonadales bacterium]|nr:hypothetical protein [Candidatus Saccharimonadales bacterium]
MRQAAKHNKLVPVSYITPSVHGCSVYLIYFPLHEVTIAVNKAANAAMPAAIVENLAQKRLLRVAAAFRSLSRSLSQVAA